MMFKITEVFYKVFAKPAIELKKITSILSETSFRTLFIWKESDESGRFARYLDAFCGLLCKSFIGEASITT